MGLFSCGAAKELRCSFCDKAQADVAKLIAGPVACICDECVSVCIDILGDDAANQGRRRQYDSVLEVHGGPPTSLGAGGRCGLCGMSLSLNDMTLVESRGLLCRPCISAVAAASADSPDPNDPQQAP